MQHRTASVDITVSRTIDVAIVEQAVHEPKPFTFDVETLRVAINF